MSIEEGVFEIRRRIATLEGLRAQSERELIELKDIPCPACSGKGQFGEDRGTEGTFYTNCDLCNGSGKARGKTGY